MAGFQTTSIETLPPHEVPTISTSDLQQRLATDQNFVLLDIRTIEGEKYWINDPRRLHIPLDELPARYKEIPTDKLVTLIDIIGRRTAIAARFLHSRGFADMDKVGGGMSQWVKDGFPITEAK